MENSPGACVNMCSKYVTIFQKLNESKCLSVFLFLSALSLLRACALVGGPCAFSVSPSPFGLDFGTLDFGLTMTCSSGLGSRLLGWSTAQSVTVDTTSLRSRGGE